MPEPFPRSMRFDEEFDRWRGPVGLPEFRNVRIQVPGRKASPGAVELRVEADDDGPTAAQAAAYTHLLDQQAKARDACLRGIVRTAKRMRRTFEGAGWLAPEQLEAVLPKSPTADALRTRVQRYDVSITDRTRGGVAYVEYSFNSAWDREHGLLVVLHRDRLVFSDLTGSGWSE